MLLNDSGTAFDNKLKTEEKKKTKKVIGKRPRTIGGPPDVEFDCYGHCIERLE
jgi:hypothetical protein